MAIARLLSKPLPLWARRRTVFSFALLAALAIQQGVGTVLVEGPSMEPTVHSGEYLFVAKGPFAGKIDEGDVVVIEHEADGSQMIKRVHRLAGGTVDVWRSPLDHFGRGTTPYVVPAGTVYVLGDNPYWSADSREFGPVPVDRIVGKVIGVPKRKT